MHFERFVQTRAFALSDGSMYERLRRHPDVTVDPHIANASLVYEPRGASVLETLHREYLGVGQRYGLPMFALTDTWRANSERIHKSRFRDRRVNQDNARSLTGPRDGYQTHRGACQGLHSVSPLGCHPSLRRSGLRQPENTNVRSHGTPAMTMHPRSAS